MQRSVVKPVRSQAKRNARHRGISIVRDRVFSDLGRNYRAEALLLPYANINVTHYMHRPVFNMQM